MLHFSFISFSFILCAYLYLYHSLLLIRSSYNSFFFILYPSVEYMFDACFHYVFGAFAYLFFFQHFLLKNNTKFKRKLIEWARARATERAKETKEKWNKKVTTHRLRATLNTTFHILCCVFRKRFYVLVPLIGIYDVIFNILFLSSCLSFRFDVAHAFVVASILLRIYARYGSLYRLMWATISFFSVFFLILLLLLSVMGAFFPPFIVDCLSLHFPFHLLEFLFAFRDYWHVLPLKLLFNLSTRILFLTTSMTECVLQNIRFVRWVRFHAHLICLAVAVSFTLALSLI